MMYIDTPGAPSRTMTSDGGKSATLRQDASLIRLSGLSSPKSLTFFRNWPSCSASLTATDIGSYQVHVFAIPGFFLLRTQQPPLVSHRGYLEVKGLSGTNLDFPEVPVSNPGYGQHSLLFQHLRYAPGTGRTSRGWYAPECRLCRFR